MSGGLRAGELEHRIQIQPVTIVQTSSSGLPQKTWPEGARFFVDANVKQLRGSEKFQSGREMGTTLWEFKVWYNPSITLQSRVSWNNLLFDIQEIPPMGSMNREFMIFRAEILETQ